MTVEKKAKDLVNKFLRLSETCNCLEYHCICRDMLLITIC